MIHDEIEADKAIDRKLAKTRGALHVCKTRAEWLANTHYMCPCGHVEWAHYVSTHRCAHCNCTRYAGEPAPSEK